MTVKSVLREKQRRFYGTAAEFAAYMGTFAPGDQWEFTDQSGRVDEFNGTVWTTVVASGGAAQVSVQGMPGADQTNDIVVVEQGQFSYDFVDVGMTDQVLGSLGAAGDLIHTLVCTVSAAATSQVQLKDGSGGTARTLLPNNVGGGVGVYTIPLNVVSANAGGWRVSTGTGVTVFAVGRFT